MPTPSQPNPTVCFWGRLRHGSLWASPHGRLCVCSCAGACVHVQRRVLACAWVRVWAWPCGHVHRCVGVCTCVRACTCVCMGVGIRTGVDTWFGSAGVPGRNVAGRPTGLSAHRASQQPRGGPDLPSLPESRGGPWAPTVTRQGSFTASHFAAKCGGRAGGPGAPGPPAGQLRPLAAWTGRGGAFGAAARRSPGPAAHPQLVSSRLSPTCNEAMPKSAIRMLFFSSRSRFSGFRSLWLGGKAALRLTRPQAASPPLARPRSTGPAAAWPGDVTGHQWEVACPAQVVLGTEERGPSGSHHVLPPTPGRALLHSLEPLP